MKKRSESARFSQWDLFLNKLSAEGEKTIAPGYNCTQVSPPRPVTDGDVPAISQDVAEVDLPELLILVDALNSGNGAIRAEAVSALREFVLEYPEAAHVVSDYLSEAMTDSESSVRRAAAESLGSVGDHRAIPVLVIALLHDNDEIRRVAALSLGAIGSRSALIPLALARNDPNSAVRQAAGVAMYQIGVGIVECGEEKVQ